MRAFCFIGGIGRKGKYLSVAKGTPLKITLEKPHSYFGAWLFSVGGSGVVKFYSKGTLFFEFTAAELNRMLADTKLNYNTQKAILNQSVYANFICDGCLIDKVELSYPDDVGALRLDNVRVGDFNLKPNAPRSGVRTLTKPVIITI